MQGTAMVLKAGEPSPRPSPGVPGEGVLIPFNPPKLWFRHFFLFSDETK